MHPYLYSLKVTHTAWIKSYLSHALIFVGLHIKNLFEYDYFNYSINCCILFWQQVFYQKSWWVSCKSCYLYNNCTPLLFWVSFANSISTIWNLPGSFHLLKSMDDVIISAGSRRGNRGDWVEAPSLETLWKGYWVLDVCIDLRCQIIW